LDVLLSLPFSRSAFERLLPHLPDLKSFNVWSVLKSSFGPLSGTRETDVVLDFFGLRGVDASLGQIAVRNKSFPERPAFGEPLMRHYFCFSPKADAQRPPLNDRFRGKSRHHRLTMSAYVPEWKLRLRRAAYVHYRLVLECPIIKVAKRGTIRKSIGHDARLSVVMARAAFGDRPR